MYETFQELDNLRLNFDEGGLLALNISLGFIMFGVALGIRLRNFKTLFMRPKAIIVGFVSQFFALPALTFLLAVLLHNHITVGVALGMILVAACPGGNISNFISSLAKGNVELSISLTAIATMLAVVMTPFNFAFWGDLYISYLKTTDQAELLQPLTIDAIEMFKQVFILLGIPVIVGMIFAWKLPKVTAKIIKPIQRVSILVFMAIVVLAFVKNYDYFVQFIFLHHDCGFNSQSFGTHHRILTWPAYLKSTVPVGAHSPSKQAYKTQDLALVLLFNDKYIPR
jgi:BASS family bile acid:Na+ symporter